MPGSVGRGEKRANVLQDLRKGQEQGPPPRPLPPPSGLLGRPPAVGERNVPAVVVVEPLYRRGLVPPRPEVGPPGPPVARVHGVLTDHVLRRRRRLPLAPPDGLGVVGVGEDDAGHVEEDVGRRALLPPPQEGQDAEDVRGRAVEAGAPRAHGAGPGWEG